MAIEDFNKCMITKIRWNEKATHRRKFQRGENLVTVSGRRKVKKAKYKMSKYKKIKELKYQKLEFFGL